MKSQADKILAEKLTSIESLPEGYAPNLDAKWAIIQGSVEKKPLGNYKLWISIAACLLILIGSAVVWNIMNRPASTIVIHAPAQIPSVDNVSPKQNVIDNDNHNTANIIRIKHLNRRKATKENNVITQEPLIEIIPAPVESVEINNEVAVQEPQVKKKQHYVEVDFNDPVQQSKKPDNNFAQAVKFKFDLGNGHATPSYSKNGTQLRIRTNF